MKNEQKLSNNQKGLSHILLIVIVLAVVGVVGYAGIRVAQNNPKSNNSTTSNKSSNNDKYEDKRVDNATLNSLSGTEANDE